MLKDIRIHIDSDEQQQAELEQQLAEKISVNYPQNIRAFNANIPSLLPTIRTVHEQRISIFCNKNAEANIVDYRTGRALYGLHPGSEIEQQVALWCKHPARLSMQGEKATSAMQGSDDFESRLSQRLNLPGVPDAINTLVILGIGMGQHLHYLLERLNIQHLVIYEPQPQYLRCSAMLTDWQDIFRLAKKNNTQLYMQVGKDARELVENIGELQQHFDISDVYVFQHYHHAVFDAIYKDLTTRSWEQIKAEGLKLIPPGAGAGYLPLVSPPVDIDELRLLDEGANARFEDNMQAFKKYFPDIYQEFKQYQPTDWFTVYHPEHRINLLFKDDLSALYGESPAREGRIQKENFTRYPNKDGLVLGYSGEKLKDYLHYQYVKQTEEILDGLEEKGGTLPDKVKALIMFGLAAGYQLESLLADHQIEKLFICEPNRDFFYASLFAIDWAGILAQIDQAGGRLYLNVGDDGSNLFKDLLAQFYAVGPYVLANTYFYQSYYNPHLTQAVANLREQLQVVIGMGEYFDHARYGIAHTRETIRRGYRFLTQAERRPLPYQLAEVPVFIVGNGPSLDSSLDVLREWQDQAIIISCGTALMPLYKAGIVPDYHAEIEQNRSTFDWCSRVGDFDFLKQITLLSCNGIHPDTCDLFKDVLIAFKNGESSTASAIEVIGAGVFHELQFAFPTVSNLVVNLVCELNFSQLYLFGVDLGFVDDKHHHSKQSGYYDEQGNELYDYREKENTAIRVPGNFRPQVYTKYEFKVSKSIIEQALATHPAVDCFNCSDGARIAGATPLQLNYVLITSPAENKTRAVKHLHDTAFMPVDNHSDYPLRFDARFMPDVLEHEFKALTELVKKAEPTKEGIEQLIEQQNEFVIRSYQSGHSLLFYLMNGTLNYTNALFSKISNSKEANNLNRRSLSCWQNFLRDLIKAYLPSSLELDVVSSFLPLRVRSWFKLISTKKRKISSSLPTHITSKITSYFENWELTKIEGAEWNLSASLSKSKRKLACETVNSVEFIYSVEDITFPSISVYTQTPSRRLILIGANPPTLMMDGTDKGALPIWYDEMWLGLLVNCLESAQGTTVCKLRYHLPESSQTPLLLDELTNKLRDIKHYIDFGFYIFIPEPNVSTEQMLLDGLGNRGVYHQGPPSSDMLISYVSNESLLKMRNLYGYNT